MQTVLFTGFGPFRDHPVNASWEAVKLLPSKDIKEDIKIIVEKIPVVYKDVDDKIEALWEQHNPNLVIHVGVSSLANKITIEKRACRHGYEGLDIMGHCKNQVCSPQEGNDIIECQINAQKICNEINNIYNKIIACTSENAGRFLCEYTFYKSLKKNKNKTLFIHVPPISETVSAENLAEYLLLIMEFALKEIENCECLP